MRFRRILAAITLRKPQALNSGGAGPAPGSAAARLVLDVQRE